MERLKIFFKRHTSKKIFNFLKFIKHNEWLAFITFLRKKHVKVTFDKKVKILKRIYSISNRVDSPHTQKEILTFIQAILELPDSLEGKVIEAGCYKGSSTAKFSIAAKKAGRQLIVFDSFEGIPDNNEKHDKNIFGGTASFKKGDWCGQIDEVKHNVRKYGEISACTFVQGWFEDTLPSFQEKLAAVYLDVDLVSSTRTCIKHLYPLLSPGGVLFSQDGHLPLVLELLNDDNFWENEVGCPKPKIEGFNRSKLIKITKY